MGKETIPFTLAARTCLALTRGTIFIATGV